MGIGKSTLYESIKHRLPNHVFSFCETPTMDVGDVYLPKIGNIKSENGKEFVEFVPNEGLGFHLDKPIFLVLDELSKANQSVQRAFLNLAMEQKAG